MISEKAEHSTFGAPLRSPESTEPDEHHIKCKAELKHLSLLYSQAKANSKPVDEK